MRLLLITMGLLAVTTMQPRVDALVAAVKPALPYPGATADGELPADNSAESKWFVVWPTRSDDVRVVVKANPLHPENQRAAARAMDDINAAVAAAERKAQEAYDKALEQLRKTGKAGDLDTITLDDEGIAGERIDAELEVTIELQAVAPFVLTAAEAPAIAAGSNGPAWTLTVAAHTYRGTDRREHYRAAETVLYFGGIAKPTVARQGNDPRFAVGVASVPGAFAVAIRGNETMVRQVVTGANWAELARR